MEIKEKPTYKNRLSSVLRNWLPILQANLSELEDSLKKYREENPFLEIHSGFENSFSNFAENRDLENFASNKSLYSTLLEQIVSPLFPTPFSREVAKKIVEDIDENGYFSGDLEGMAYEFEKSLDEVEEIRGRFKYLEPSGVGALNMVESLLFQLETSNLDDEVYELSVKIVQDLENIHKFKNIEGFEKAAKTIRHLQIPPAVEFFEESQKIVPDLYIINDGGFKIFGNESHYPKIEINRDLENLDSEFVSQKLQEAKLLIDAVQMRKATLYKIGVMLLEYQYDFFMGGEIKPLTLQVLADEFGHNISTISRAVSNKYIQCNRGVYPMKFFFSAEVDDGISNNSIRNRISEIISKENKNSPLSDEKILHKVREQFGDLKLVRRTVTKYRKQLGIPTSSQRKKLYSLK
jgi:RNA polymerase sigma-54 factor